MDNKLVYLLLQTCLMIFFIVKRTRELDGDEIGLPGAFWVAFLIVTPLLIIDGFVHYNNSNLSILF